MSEDDALRKAVEGMVDKEGVDDVVFGDLDLPRIVVTEDNILVFEENDWVEKYTEGVKREEEEEDDSVVDDLVLMEKGFSNVLENIVGRVNDNVLEDVGSGDFYKAEKDVDEFYDGEVHGSGSKEGVDEGHDVLTEQSVQSGFVDIDEVGRRKRSMLEVSGFEDIEVERKREIKRRLTWG